MCMLIGIFFGCTEGTLSHFVGHIFIQYPYSLELCSVITIPFMMFLDIVKSSLYTCMLLCNDQIKPTILLFDTVNVLKFWNISVHFIVLFCVHECSFHKILRENANSVNRSGCSCIVCICLFCQLVSEN